MLTVKLKNLTLSIICVGLSLTAGLSQAAGEAPKSEARCQACHGKGGAKPINDTYPKLAGQNKGYLIESLKAYKGDKRTGGLSGVMAVQAKMLSDAEIEALATYYSSQK